MDRKMLPGEILCFVYEYCDAKDLARSIEISRYFNVAMKSWGAKSWGALIHRKWYGSSKLSLARDKGSSRRCGCCGGNCVRIGQYR